MALSLRQTEKESSGMQTFSQIRCLALMAVGAVFLFAGAPQMTAAVRRGGPAGQGQGEPQHAKVELIAESPAATGAAKTIWTGVLFHLDTGWHIYWQNAGDSGTPPKIEWQLPAGYRAGAIRWPTPVRLGHGSIVDYGYEGEVLLMAPIERGPAAQPQAGAQNDPVSISALVKYVVCSDVCIPGRAHPTLSLAHADSPADAANWPAIFRRTRAQLPRPAPASWKASAQAEKDDFVLSVHTGTPVKGAMFLPLDVNQIENSAPQAFTSASNGFRLTLRKSEQLSTPVTTLQGLVVLGPGQAFQVSAPVAAR
jgi:DsbC/DsbD-like thiol-disulfide interchange protein